MQREKETPSTYRCYFLNCVRTFERVLGGSLSLSLSVCENTGSFIVPFSINMNSFLYMHLIRSKKYAHRCWPAIATSKRAEQKKNIEDQKKKANTKRQEKNGKKRNSPSVCQIK